VNHKPVELGTILFTLVDPHRGHEVAYNRWYERDHFYAATMAGPGVFAGADLAFAVTVFQFAAGLVVRQQYVPSIEEKGGAWCAVWRPAMEGPDAERFAALARVMPPACRAISMDASRPPDVHGAGLLYTLVGALVELFLGVKAEGRSLESIATPLSAEKIQ